VVSRGSFYIYNLKIFECAEENQNGAVKRDFDVHSKFQVSARIIP
jgi:hypothetical protein